MFSIDMLVLLQIAGQSEARIIVALSCVVVASVLALTVSIALMRRIQEIAAQPPSKNSNNASNESQTKEPESGDQAHHR